MRHEVLQTKNQVANKYMRSGKLGERTTRDERQPGRITTVRLCAARIAAHLLVQSRISVVFSAVENKRERVPGTSE